MERFVVLFEAPITRADYDTIMRDVEASGILQNENLLSHAAFERKGMWCVVDVWNSLESFQQFAETVLKPTFQKLNLDVPPPTMLPVYRYEGAGARKAVSA